MSDSIQSSRDPVSRPRGRVIALLDADPELGAQLAGSALEAARSQLRARSVDLATGLTRLPVLDPEQGHLGMLVVSGALMRLATVGRVSFAELVGPGDLLRQAAAAPRRDAEWRAIQTTQLALLDRSLAATAARWPEISAGILDRSVARACRLAMQVAVCHMRRVDQRLLLLLWMLADRWGRVRKDGVSVSLPLTHEVLAALVGSHRPTVTAALKKLDLQGAVERKGEGAWLLKGRRPEELDRMYASVT